MSTTESLKNKVIKDDALIDIKVNKTYYMMCKAALFTLFKTVHDKSNENAEDFIKEITSAGYEKLDENQRVFYTLTLLVGEIEKQAMNSNLFIDKEDNEKIKKDLTKSDSKEESNED